MRYYPQWPGGSGRPIVLRTAPEDLQRPNLKIRHADGSANYPLLLNGWLQDTYPEATEVGTVALSSFTTKLAIFA